MSTFAIPPAPPHHFTSTSLSPSAWRRIRTILSLSVLGIATAAGIGLGTTGATVSPVSIAAAAVAPPAAAPPAAQTAVDSGRTPAAAPHHGGPHRR